MVARKQLTWKIGHEIPAYHSSLTPSPSMYTPSSNSPPFHTPCTPTPQLEKLKQLDLCELHPNSKVETDFSTSLSSPTPPPVYGKPAIHPSSNKNVATRPGRLLSRLPGLNPDHKTIAQYQMKVFRTLRTPTDESEYIRLCRQGGRKNLIHHAEMELAQNARKERPHLLFFGGTRNTEIPMIEQIRMKRCDNKNMILRKDIVPVENGAKVFLAFNRTKGTITRVLATQPRPFRF